MLQAADQDTRLRLPAEQAAALVHRFGTPLYVVDEDHFRQRIQRYKAAFEAAYPKTELSYASKANSTLAVLAIAAQEGCTIDVASEGELRAAIQAGVQPSHCHLHGNNKSPSEIAFALEQGIGAIVVDNFQEIDMLAQLRAQAPLILRLAPGVDPQTHHKISTGQADTKFGFNIADGSAERALVKCVGQGLNLIGYHCHVGSQLLDPEAQIGGGEFLSQFARDMKASHNFETKIINVGGGLGVRYTDADMPMPVEDYCRLVVAAITEGLKGTGLEPILAQEPGRSLIAESGVTLYRVGVIKRVPIENGSRTYVVVDGGLSDNPRPALYESRYTVERVGPPAERTQTVTVSGKHCETDRLFADVELPSDLEPGDVLQVLCTGAYNSSMASNYNRFPRPATALLRPGGEAVLIQQADTWEQMFARESVPSDLRPNA